MMRLSVLGQAGPSILLVVGLLGCSPSSFTEPDEFKNPHYLTGKSRLASMDFEGAVAAFEKALQANPNSAAAHLELGLLYESERLRDHAAAIYHFEKHLKLKPDSNVADGVRQRIHSCKLELAKSVSFALVSRLAQNEMNRLKATNATLHEVLRRLEAQVSYQAALLSNHAAGASGELRTALNSGRWDSAGLGKDRNPGSRSGSGGPPVPSRATWHEVQSGETLYSIARHYDLRMDQLAAANPNINPRRLRPGQKLALPPARN